ncbi:OTU domain-containing protein isoform X1 [Chlorella sorokiniana]|uniref:OTU domain-containing protein isoform X1 n=1 Tax=Chlorella sorokiniana TaxID=3076 RepID=A0A2P6TMT7_CHLSO|nr:OTU domain-containing protein isoform X1 [Chlorella sorokiniana]|eukprot:PRW45646.1 OTU domain-containing protein isoform X1 [Chlorella sorokiniana]
MSKKNNQQTRQRMHAARLEKEKEDAAKRDAKLAKKQQRLKAAESMGVAAPKRLKRKQKKGVRIKKHVVIRGVKITDAESKRKVKEMLAAEEAMKDLMMDAEGGEPAEAAAAAPETRMREAPSGVKKAKARSSGGTKIKVKSAAKAAKKAAKAVHTKPTDREVVAAGEAAAAAAASTVQRTAEASKTVSGYLLHEAPVRTWLPLLGCSVAAAAGAYMQQRRLEWAALGGALSFFLTVWQVLAPLVRRFMALRARLLDNDRAAKKRLDLAAEQLNKVARDRGHARQQAQQAQGEVHHLKQAISTTVAAAGGLWPPISGGTGSASSGSSGSGYSSSGESDAASAVEQAARRLEALRSMLEERREQDKRLLGVLNNALNAAAVPNILDSEHGCTDTPDDATDGFGERPIDRGDAMELAGALQGRVDALRRQVMEAAEAQEAAASVHQRAEAQQGELIRLHSELRERTDEATALHAQLEIAKAEAGRLPQLQERLESLERQLARFGALHAEREGLQAQLERLQQLEEQTGKLQRQLAQREAELAAERQASAEWRSSASSSDGSGPEEASEEEGAGQEGGVAGNGASRHVLDVAAGEAADHPEPAGHPEAAAAAAAADEQPAAAHRPPAAAPLERPTASASAEVLSGLLGVAVAAGAATAAAASKEEEHKVAAELDTVRVKLRRAERFLLAYDKAVPALAGRLQTLQAQHAQLERTQAELIAQHQADEAAGSKCLELAEAVLAAAHDVEGVEQGSPPQLAPSAEAAEAAEGGAEPGAEAAAAAAVEDVGAERNNVVPAVGPEGGEFRSTAEATGKQPEGAAALNGAAEKQGEAVAEKGQAAAEQEGHTSEAEADWAEDFWRQQPGWQDGSAAEQQRQSAEAAAAAAAAADAAARYDAQLAADEALAQSLHEQELRQLSGEDRERLRRLPAMLAETPLVRRMSETLASLSGGSFSKLIPATRSSMQLALPEEGPEEEARRRLDERLTLFCLVERKVKGDGNCQFRALSDQLFRTPRLHGFVRECVVQQLRRCPEAYQDYVLDSSYEHYCSEMARPGTWGDNVTLQAAADYFGVRVGIISSFAENYLIEVEPRERKSSRVLWLAFWAEVHYNSLYPESEPPPPLPEDKLLGSRRLYNLLWGSPGSSSGPRSSVWGGPWDQSGGGSSSSAPSGSSSAPSSRQGGGSGVRIIPVE